MKKKVIALITAVSMVAVSGCTGNTTSKVENNSEPVEYFIKNDDRLMDFSMNLLKTDYKNGQNILVSPLSVIYALGMTANGAEGITKEEMENVIGVPVDEINDFAQNYIYKISGLTDTEFNLADSIWVNEKQNVKLEDKFVEDNKTYYNAEIYNEKFNDKTVKKINKWVDKNTNHMIDKIIDEIPEDAAMYLINALAFEARWSEPYQEGQVEDGKFKNYDNSEADVSFLTGNVDNYMEDGDSIGFMKPYSGNDYGFFAILPNEDIGIDEFVKILDTEKFKNLVNNATSEYEVFTKTPKFEVDYGTSLVEPLSKMGMSSAFGDKADFTSMVKEGSTKLNISEVLHKTYMKVDEEGTKAAAVTSVEMKCMALAPEEREVKEVILDRPFVYGIIDYETLMPIFTGVMNEM